MCTDGVARGGRRRCGLPDRLWRDAGSRRTPRRGADRRAAAARAVAAHPLRRTARSYLNVHGQGEVVDHGRCASTGRPPADGGVLHFEYAIDHARDSGGQDARITESWALLKLDRLFPPAKVRVAERREVGRDAAPRRRRTDGRSKRRTVRPKDTCARSTIRTRNFDRPKGWLLAGTLAIRRDVVAGPARRRRQPRRLRVQSERRAGVRALDAAVAGADIPAVSRAAVDRQRAGRHVARRFVRRRFDLSACRPSVDQPERHQHAAARDGARCERVARHRRRGLDRRRHRRVLQPRGAAPLEHDQRTAICRRASTRSRSGAKGTSASRRTVRRARRPRTR